MTPFEQFIQLVLTLPQSAQIILGLIAIPWLMNFLDIFFRGSIRNSCKLDPNSPIPVFSFYTSTMVHKDWKHLRGNTLPLLLLGSGTLLSGTEDFWIVTNGIILLTGAGLWLFSKNPVLGASGLIAGYFGYLLTQMIISPEYVDLILGVIVSVVALIRVGIRQLFGLFVAFRATDAVSRLGHSLGLVSGVVAAFILQWIERVSSLAA